MSLLVVEPTAHEPSVLVVRVCLKEKLQTVRIEENTLTDITAMVMSRSVFRNITPCSSLKVNGHFGGTCRFHLQGRRINQARNQKMDTKCSSETSLDFQRTTRRFNPEDRSLRFNSYLSAGFTQDGDVPLHMQCIFYVIKFCKIVVLWRLPS
jgi:hypothetical protein